MARRDGTEKAGNPDVIWPCEYQPLIELDRARQRVRQWVYFIHCEGEGIKVGTSRNPLVRFMTAQGLNPTELVLICVVSSAELDEYAAHAMFADVLSEYLRNNRLLGL